MEDAQSIGAATPPFGLLVPSCDAFSLLFVHMFFPLCYYSPFFVSAGVSDLLYTGLAYSLHVHLHLVLAFVPLFSMIPHRQAFRRSLRAISLTDQI